MDFLFWILLYFLMGFGTVITVRPVVKAFSGEFTSAHFLTVIFLWWWVWWIIFKVECKERYQ